MTCGIRKSNVPLTERSVPPYRISLQLVASDGDHGDRSSALRNVGGGSTAKAVSDWANMNQGAVRPGQVYHSIEVGIFGARGPEWQVVSVARRNDGLTYATLAMSRDPSERKTLAVGALLDRRMYRLVADAPADELTIPEC